MSLRTHSLTALFVCAVVATTSNLTDMSRAGNDPDAAIPPASPLKPRVVDTRIDDLSNRISSLQSSDSSTMLRLRVPVQSSALAVVTETLPDVSAPNSNDMKEVERSISMAGSLAQVIKVRQRAVTMLPTLQPCRGTFTSPFGVRVHPISGKVKMHEGMDLAAPNGTPIYASGDGIVSMAERHNGYGNEVMIDHGLGYQTLYGHTSKMLVKEGDTVKRGQIIALVGSTGASTGPHLHYEVWVDGVKVDPSGFLMEPLPELPKPAVVATKRAPKSNNRKVSCKHGLSRKRRG